MGKFGSGFCKYSNVLVKDMRETACWLQALFLLCLFFFVECASLAAQTPNLEIEDISATYQIGPQLQLLDPPPATFSIDSLLKGKYDSSFKPLSNSSQELTTHQDYWTKLTINNHLEKKQEATDWVFHFSLILTDIEVFTVYENGNIVHAKSGFFTPFAARTFQPTHKINLVRVQLPPGEKATIYTKSKSERNGLPPKFSATLVHINRFYQDLNHRKQVNGIFIGFVLMILIYNLFLFISTKDKAFVYYSGYLLSIVVFSIYNTGDLADMLTNTIFAIVPQLIYFFKITVYIFIVTYLTFLRVFLRLPKLLPNWDKIFKRFILWFVLPATILEVSMLVYTQYNFDRVDIISIVTTLVFLMISTTFLFPLYRTRDKKGYFIIGGFVAMGTGIFLTILARFQSVDFTTFFFRLGTIFEIIIFSLGLIYRQQEKEKQRQKAFFELEKSKILQQQKAQKAAQLEELDHLKTAFYTNITHEFRTPLTVIMGMTDNIKGHQREKDLIQRNSSNLLDLINQLLDLSKLDAGHKQIHYLQADIVPFLQYLTESFYSLAMEKGIQIRFSSKEASIVMDFDETKIQYIVNNLISNAVKFTEEGGQIDSVLSVENRQGTNHLKIQIKDTGIGIKPEKTAHIFDRFYQAHDSHKGGYGTGIGLTICKEITELLGGSIQVESVLDKGTTFTVLLPISNQAELLPQLDLKIESVPLPIPPDSPALKKEELGQPIILVVEDNRDVAEYIKTILQNDYRVELANNGQSGIDKAFDLIPDIVIADVMMPKKNGYEVTYALKNDQRTSHIPVVILTAKATEVDKLHGLQSGADAYLKKPFNKAELLVRLENLLKLKKEIQDNYSVPKINRPANSKGTTKVLLKEKPVSQSLDDQFIQLLHQEIEKRLDDPTLTISDLCTATGLSHSQLYRKLKALTDQTPVHFIRTYRLHKAEILLRKGNYNVSEVAYLVGFNDPNYFSRTYSQEFGRPPSEVRVNGDK